MSAAEEFEVARLGAWWATLARIDVKAFGGRTLFAWSVGHDTVGRIWSGFNRDADIAAELASAQFDLMKGLGS